MRMKQLNELTEEELTTLVSKVQETIYTERGYKQNYAHRMCHSGDSDRMLKMMNGFDIVCNYASLLLERCTTVENAIKIIPTLHLILDVGDIVKTFDKSDSATRVGMERPSSVIHRVVSKVLSGYVINNMWYDSETNTMHKNGKTHVYL